MRRTRRDQLRLRRSQRPLKCAWAKASDIGRMPGGYPQRLCRCTLSKERITMRVHLRIALLVLGLAAGSSPSIAAAQLAALPEGDTGIAARHPNDQGIASDSEVLFADN